MRHRLGEGAIKQGQQRLRARRLTIESVAIDWIGVKQANAPMQQRERVRAIAESMKALVLLFRRSLASGRLAEQPGRNKNEWRKEKDT